MYKIGEVVRKLNISGRRIIEYEKIGLIKPKRESLTNDRLFTDFEVRQIKKIQKLIHKHGFTLTSIVYLLNIAPCWKIFNCKSPKCPAYKNLEKKCWKLIGDGTSNVSTGECSKCAILLASKKSKGFILLERPTKN